MLWATILSRVGKSIWLAKATASSRSPARVDEMRQLQSQIIVPADHSGVHRHPQSILEVRRVLFEQLAELQEFPL